MPSSSSWAQHSLIDPLTEPDPSEDTGLNSHFRSSYAPRSERTTTQYPSPPPSAGLNDHANVDIQPQTTGSTANTNPFRRSTMSSPKSPTTPTYGQTTPRHRQDYPSPQHSPSPLSKHFPKDHRREAFGDMNSGRPRRSSQPIVSKPAFETQTTPLSRGGSLRERYPGDNSHRPLDSIRRESRIAHRAPHLRKKNFHGADRIDRLDDAGFMYHHEGPYDAANIARNRDWKYSPIAAVHDSNEEALRATPRENIIDAITKHRPLEGVAVIPPGVPDRFGRVLDYKEGADLQRERGGDYRRWPGVEYLEGDLKGKGEPSYTIEKALKDHKHSKQRDEEGIELQTRRRNHSLSGAPTPSMVPGESLENGNGLGRSHTTGRSIGNTLKKRFGSIRRKRATAEQ